MRMRLMPPLHITYAITLFEIDMLHVWYVMCLVCIRGQYLNCVLHTFLIFGCFVYVEATCLDYVCWLPHGPTTKKRASVGLTIRLLLMVCHWNDETWSWVMYEHSFIVNEVEIRILDTYVFLLKNTWVLAFTYLSYA